MPRRTETKNEVEQIISDNTQGFYVYERRKSSCNTTLENTEVKAFVDSFNKHIASAKNGLTPI